MAPASLPWAFRLVFLELFFPSVAVSQFRQEPSVALEPFRLSWTEQMSSAPVSPFPLIACSGNFQAFAAEANFVIEAEPHRH